MTQFKRIFNLHTLHRCCDIILLICLALLDAVCLDPIALVKFIKRSNLIGQCFLGICSLALFVLTIYLAYQLYLHLQNRYRIHTYTYKDIIHTHLTQSNWANILFTILAIIICDIIFSALSSAIYGTHKSANQAIINSLTSRGTIPFIVVILLSVFCAPVAEEFIYRGCLLSFFKYPSKSLIALPCLISGFAFGLAHVSTNIVSFLSFMVAGMLLAHCYLKSYHLKSSIYTHILFNAITWSLTFIA